MSKIIEAVVDAVEWLGGLIVDAVVAVVEAVWNNIAMPLLEGAFALIGIEDETVVNVDKVSSKLYGEQKDDTVQKALTKAVIGYQSQPNARWMAHFSEQVNVPRAQLMSFYLYGRDYYTFGLPELIIYGQQFNSVELVDAIEDDTGKTGVIVTKSKLETPSFVVYNKWILQEAPYNYRPGFNTLTYPNGDGHDRLWDLVSIVDNTTNYRVNIERDNTRDYAWLEGPTTVVESETATIKIQLSDPVPAGKNLTVNLAYSGNAIQNTDYTAPSSAVITGGNDSVTFTINTIENGAADGSREIVISIGSIDNSEDAFDEIIPDATRDTVSIFITDNEGVILTMPGLAIAENVSTAVLPVTLRSAAAGAFTVDYVFVNGSATGGTDFDNTPGTLNFAGTTGEVQNINIPITADLLDDDAEDFQVVLQNCSDPAVTLSSATLKIFDGSNRDITTVVTVSDFFFLPLYTQKSLVVAEYYTVTPANWFYWLYDQDTNVYPGAHFIDQEFSNLEMIPVVILRRDEANIVAGTDEYLHANRMVDRLQFNLEDLLSSVEEQGEQAIDAYLNFAVCPSDQNRIVSKVLYRTFYFMHVTQGLTSTSNEYKALFKEQDVQNALVWYDYNWTPGKPGTLPIPVGEYSHIIETTQDEEGEDVDYITLRHRTGTNTYDELKLVALSSVCAIEKSGHHAAAYKSLRDEGFTVPLSYFIFRELTPIETVELYGYLLRIDVNAGTITELEWYETEAFADFFQFAMLVINVLSLGSASSFTALAWAVVRQYLVFQLVQYVVELTGNELLAALIGVIASVALGGGKFDFGDLMDAEQLLEITTNFAENFSAAYGTTNEQLKEDMEKFTEEYEQRVEALDELNDSLDRTVDAQFLTYLQSVNTNLYKAVQNQYDYDIVYNGPDLAVSQFVDTKLKATEIV
jgi:hypothetical protein